MGGRAEVGEGDEVREGDAVCGEMRYGRRMR